MVTFFCHDHEVQGKEPCNYQCKGCKDWFGEPETKAITVKVTRSVLNWLLDEVFPTSEDMAIARTSIYQKNDVEFVVNTIVKYVFVQVVKKFTAKQKTAAKSFTIKLQDAEAITLFRFLHNYPILEKDYWKQVQRNGIVNELCKQLPLLADLK